MKRLFQILLVTCLFSCKTKTPVNNEPAIKALLDKANTSDSVKDYKQSIKYYSEVLALDSDRLIALTNLGRAYFWNHQFEKGIAYYDKAVALYPDAKAFHRRGLAYFFEKKSDNAVRDFEKAISLDSESGEAYGYLSVAKMNLNETDSAIYYYNMAKVRACPEDILHHAQYYIYEKQRKLEDAILELGAILKLGQTDPCWCYNNLAWDKIQLHHYKNALPDINMSIQLDSNRAFSHNNKANILFHLDQTEEALKEVNVSLRMDSMNAYAYKNRGEIYLSIKKKSEACSDFEHALTLNTDSTLGREISILRSQSCK